MRIWAGGIYIISITALFVLCSIIMSAVIGAPTDSSSVQRGTLNARDQYFLIDKSQASTFESSAANTNILCSNANGVYIGVSENLEPNSIQTFTNCYTIKTESKSSWGTTYYWPKCSSYVQHENFRVMDKVGVQCAPAVMRWQDVGEHP